MSILDLFNRLDCRDVDLQVAADKIVADLKLNARHASEVAS